MKEKEQYYLGLPDESFLRGDAPMTKEEIRIMTLVKARVRFDSQVLDIGAGTGSLSIEAALTAAQGHVFAIERNEAALELLFKNKEHFACDNLTVIPGVAPDALEQLPIGKRFDAILVGGSGGRLADILDASAMRLVPGGRLVVNAVTPETTAGALNYFSQHADFTYQAVCLQATRLRPVGHYHLHQAQNPVYIITAAKKDTMEGVIV